MYGKIIKLKDQNKESGVTLLLAILVLSSITAICFSIATILFVEVRTSGDLLKTEAAFYGAQGVGEEALFGVMRKVPSGSMTYTTQTPNNKVGLSSTVSSSSDLQMRDIVKITSNSFATTTNHYVFPGSVDMFSGSNYSSVTVSFLDTGATGYLKAYMCQFDPNATNYESVPCSDPSINHPNNYWIQYTSGTEGYRYISAATSYTFTLDYQQQQELVLVNPTGSDIYVELTATNRNGQAVGIPYLNETAVDVNASFNGVTRKVRVVAPNN